ncbi:hypothetical protein C8J57DRAFT_1466790 [Mycena rebaudengoi]|nr:hypothetical protein C8J57DRAFT_1466790 [Mycena rebaudengoi]
MRSEISLCDCCNRTFCSDQLPNPTETAQLASLLRSNCEPSDPSYCRAVIASSPVELARFDKEIGRLRGILDQVQTARAALQFHRDACQSVLSAVHRLPSETLCAIFSLIPVGTGRDRAKMHIEEELEKDEIECVSRANLLRIACVCARWHGVIMGDPALWSDITLDLGTLCWHSSKRGRMLNLLKSVLDRGSNTAITVHVTDSNNFGPTPSKPLKLLAQYSRRWRDVALVIAPTDSGCMSAAQGHLPLLETLSITGGYPQLLDDLLDSFCSAPRLTRLSVSGPSSALSTFPLKQLQYLSLLELDTEDLDGALALMGSLSNTATFLINIVTNRGPSPTFDHDYMPAVATIRAFVVSFANHRHFSFYDPATLEAVFNSVTVNFQELTVIPEEVSLAWPDRQSLPFFFSHLSLHLKVLNILDVVISADALVQCLSELPSLEQLAVSDHNIDVYANIDNFMTDSPFRRLTWTSDPSCLVPRLNSLKFRTSSLLSIDHAFLKFVVSRLKPGRSSDGPFKTTIICPNDLDYRPVEYDRLWDLKGQKELAFIHIDPWEEE